jgi:hydroxymethylpyrimidine pyrophosphatase-like HAD family hydrolase
VIIATDLDGTLTGTDPHISAENARALAMARAHGASVVLATGRPSRCLDLDHDRLELFDVVIACNGAELITAAGPKLVSPLDPRHVDAVAATLRRHAVAGSFAFEYGTRVGVESGYQGWPATDTGPAIVVAPFAGLRNLASCAKLLFLSDEAGCDEVVTLLEQELGEAVAVTHANPTGRPGPTEISAASATKGNALTAWLREVGRESEEILAFGDQLNDLSMLLLADRAYAVGAAHGSLARLFPILSNDDGAGVGRYLMSTPPLSHREGVHVR